MFVWILLIYYLYLCWLEGLVFLFSNRICDCQHSTRKYQWIPVQYVRVKFSKYSRKDVSRLSQLFPDDDDDGTISIRTKFSHLLQFSSRYSRMKCVITLMINVGHSFDYFWTLCLPWVSWKCKNVLQTIMWHKVSLWFSNMCSRCSKCCRRAEEDDETVPDSDSCSGDREISALISLARFILIFIISSPTFLFSTNVILSFSDEEWSADSKTGRSLSGNESGKFIFGSCFWLPLDWIV